MISHLKSCDIKEHVNGKSMNDHITETVKCSKKLYNKLESGPWVHFVVVVLINIHTVDLAGMYTVT